MALQHKQVMVLHTNDIHSRLDDVTRLSTLIEDYRKRYTEEELILVDLGDFMDRSSLVTEGTDGFAHRELLHEMGYDVVTLGNNECLSFTHSQLTAVYEAPTRFQVVCCNMKPINQPQHPWLLKSTVMYKNGLRIGFVGATINYTEFYRLLEWDAQEPIEAIKHEIAQLKSEIDVIVVLSHLGIQFDERLVAECPDIHIVIGAHTHHVFNPAHMLNQTLMCAGGMGGEYLGVISIKMSDQSNVPMLSGHLLKTKDYTPNEHIQGIINYYHNVAETHLDKEVATLYEDLLADDMNETPLPNLLAISLREWCNTSVAIVNSGQLLDGLSKGKVTLKDLHEVCPAPINPCILYIKGMHIKEAIEQSYLTEYRQKSLKGYGFRGKRLGYLALSGIIVKIEQKPSINDKKLHIFIEGELINLERVYKIASIDMFTFKHGYKSLGEYEKVDYFVPEYLRHILAACLQSKALIEESKILSWIELGHA